MSAWVHHNYRNWTLQSLTPAGYVVPGRLFTIWKVRPLFNHPSIPMLRTDKINMLREAGYLLRSAYDAKKLHMQRGGRLCEKP